MSLFSESQWGDEGKGKIVDLLTEQATAVVRFQGGHNAGHTLVIGGEKTVSSCDSLGCPAGWRAVPHWQWRCSVTRSAAKGNSRIGGAFCTRSRTIGDISGVPVDLAVSRCAGSGPRAAPRRTKNWGQRAGELAQPTRIKWPDADCDSGIYEIPNVLRLSCARCSTITTMRWCTTTAPLPLDASAGI